MPPDVPPISASKSARHPVNATVTIRDCKNEGPALLAGLAILLRLWFMEGSWRHGGMAGPAQAGTYLRVFIEHLCHPALLRLSASFTPAEGELDLHVPIHGLPTPLSSPPFSLKALLLLC